MNEIYKGAGYKLNIQKKLYIYVQAMNMWTLKLKSQYHFQF